VDEVQREGLAGEDEAVKVPMKKSQDEESEDVREDEVDSGVGLRVEDQVRDRGDGPRVVDGEIWEGGVESRRGKVYGRRRVQPGSLVRWDVGFRVGGTVSLWRSAGE
jgi:hypothetical protein